MAFTSNNGQTRTSLADINITPLVDVVLVLLVIFMITAPVLQSGIEVNVPKTRKHPRTTGETDLRRKRSDSPGHLSAR